METRKIFIVTVAILSAVIIFAVAQPGTAQQRRAGDQIGAECEGGLNALFDEIEIVPLTTADETDIIFLREEEKLARDVYITLGERWQLPIFRNIARSEQKHMDLVFRLIETYEMTDPVTDDTVGIFTDPGLTQLYGELVAKGETSTIDALEVGAIIEDLDLADLYELIEDTDNRHVLLVANNLAKGSRNHLRAFMRALTAQGGTYTPQYLDQETFDAIVTSDFERGVTYDADGNALEACGGGSQGWGMRRGRNGGQGNGQRGGDGSGECDGTGPQGNGNNGGQNGTTTAATAATAATE